MRHILLLPWLAVFTLFWLAPIAGSFVMSMTDYSYLTGIGSARYVGFGNYLSILSDPTFWNAVKNTLLFTGGTVPLTLVSALLLAAILNETPRMRDLFRMSVFLPSMLSVTVLCMIFDQFYTKEGIVTRLAGSLGLDSRGLLIEPGTALLAVMAMDIFTSTGYYTILFLAAMQAITPELNENARLMGARFFQRLWWVTLPMIMPMILFAVVINTIKSLQIFTEIYVLTKGGPLQSTTTVVYWLYELGFKDFDAGYASALAYLLLAATALISWAQIRLIQREVKAMP